jgi:hypothetical protein
MAGLASRFVLPYQTVIDATGVPIPGAQLYFYESGTSTPLDTFSDPNLTVPNQNPVPADAGGRFPNIFLLPQAYKVVLTDALDDEIWTADPVEEFGPGGDASSLRTVTADTTVLFSDTIIEVDATAGPVTVTYPLDLGGASQTQVVKIVKVDNTANAVNISDGTNVVGALVFPINGASCQSFGVYSTGAALRIV